MNHATPIIEIKNLGKRYDIAHQRGGYIALRDVLANVVKNPFSFLKSKAKKVVGLEKKEAFWALKDISFDVMPGEVIGVIGKNGAGKSTLLKILTGITPPTEGEAIMRGRVSSLLEVGTGFHPELTGRENIFLNGAILGMTRKEIAQKFDEIVEFSGVGKFLDTPVKHYSSGMQVRLAFSVAAHMEPDILIVDEVLAVGDAEFQKKSMGKMEEVTHKDGRTILFVSHNLGAVKQLCAKTILIEKGEIKMFGNTEEVIDFYASRTNNLLPKKTWTDNNPGDDSIKFESVCIRDAKGKIISSAFAEEQLLIEIGYEILEPVKNLQLGFKLKRNGEVAFTTGDIVLPRDKDIERQKGSHISTCIVPPDFLNHGEYTVELFCHIPNQKMIAEEDVLNIKIEAKTTRLGTDAQPGLLRPLLDWEIK